MELLESGWMLMNLRKSLRTSTWAVLGSTLLGVGCQSPTVPSSPRHLIPPLLQFERPSFSEPAYIESIERHLVDVVEERAKGGPALRDAHAKHHGCARAKFVVRWDLPGYLRSEVFQPDRCYPAYVRFSNALGTVGADKDPDVRGMAIKLMDVEGAKLIHQITQWPESVWWKREERTQDFLVINHPAFFVRGARNFDLFQRMGPLLYGLTHPGDAVRLAAMALHRVYSPLDLTYHSVTPIAMGPDYVAKLDVFAVDCRTQEPVVVRKRSRARPNYLRDALVHQLQTDGACFQIDAVARTSSKRTLARVEDARRGWEDGDSDRYPVAQLILPAQRLQPMDECEDVSMTPWHGVLAHQPVGSINRTRLPVYRAISELRHRLNQQPYFEPEAGDICE